MASSISVARTPGTSWMRSSAWRTRSAPSGWSLTALALIRLRAGGPACAAMHGAVSRCSSGSAPRCPDGSAFELPGCPADRRPRSRAGRARGSSSAPRRCAAGAILLAGGGDGLALGALVQVAEGAAEGGQRAEAFVEGASLRSSHRAVRFSAACRTALRHEAGGHGCPPSVTRHGRVPGFAAVRCPFTLRGRARGTWRASSGRSLVLAGGVRVAQLTDGSRASSGSTKL